MLKHPYFLSIVIATALAWVSWGLVLSKMSPFTSGILALAFFYASLLIGLTGTFALLLFALRRGMWKTEETLMSLGAPLREGFLLALMIETALVFQRLRVLTWWDALLLLIIALLLEFYFLAQK